MEEEEIPTAEELWGKHFNGLHYDDVTPEATWKYAIEFAKIHVDKALKEAARLGQVEEHQSMGCTYMWTVDKDSILNAYDLDDIK